MVERRSGTQAVICGKYIHIAEKGLGFMKKIITLLLTFIMCISLCACGNSKGDVSGSITTKQATIAIKDYSLDSVYDTYKKNKLNCITVFVIIQTMESRKVVCFCQEVLQLFKTEWS